ncbi:2-hydroxyacid dehydrogenase [Alicyclobacillus mengziensis]|uniref:D-glycerate dehydrogenase n=1 Tax=Alicyclobacillus mengziensis TaxID=2931921 RepID=A0A9X7W1N9_9BACL|nr:D-glycerate dehydrogenase [Alicyclobacillus mengziensis]QSO49071.1 D-glycerate dehydrogenase [Alicyclobacillus mengziensis]
MQTTNPKKVFVTRALPDEWLAPLRQVALVDVFTTAERPIDRSTLLQSVAGVDGIVSMLTDRMDDEVFEAAGTNLRVVANMAVGYDNIDLAAAAAREIVVTNTPDVLTEATADLAFGLILTTARRITEAERYLRSRQWKTWSPMLLTGVDVYGKTLGIVGLGRIGMAVARRAAGFGMHILYHNRQRNEDGESALGCHYRDLDDLLREADFVVVLVPASQGAKPMFSFREFSLMKRTAVFINVARGSLVNEEALVAALKTRRIYAAGLDVYGVEPVQPDHPLLELDNVVLLPHIGSASMDTRRRMAELAILNCRSVIEGLPPKTPVRF